jgi:hypothetical protein
VISDVNARSSAPLSKRRLTRSLGTRASKSTTVVTGANRRGQIPASRCLRIDAATYARHPPPVGTQVSQDPRRPKATFTVKWMCDQLRVSRAGFYKWRVRRDCDLVHPVGLHRVSSETKTAPPVFNDARSKCNSLIPNLIATAGPAGRTSVCRAACSRNSGLHSRRLPRCELQRCQGCQRRKRPAAHQIVTKTEHAR